VGPPAVLQALERAVDDALAVDWDGECSLGESALAVQRLQAKLAVLEARVVRSFDVSGAWQADGMRSARAWLVHHGGASPQAVGRSMARGRTLPLLPHVTAALAAGHLTLDHLTVLSRARRGREARFTDAEPFLVEQARTLAFDDWARAVAYWVQVADPDGAGDDGEALRRRRSLFTSRQFDGTGLVEAVMDPPSYATWRTELERLERSAFEADWRAARARHGAETTAAHLARTPAQRRHDALVTMAVRSAGLEHDGRPTGPGISLTAHLDWVTFCAELAAAVTAGDLDQAVADRHGLPAAEVARLANLPVAAGERTGPRVCELADGTPVLPSELLPSLIRADVRRLVFGPTGNVLDFGRRARLFRGPLRDAVLARFRTCAIEGCHVPVSGCEVDHVLPWHRNGTTSEANGRAACRHHNQNPPDP
jgi:hypothetical protein